MTDQAALLARLEEMVIPPHKSWPTHYANPDGPAAAAEIRSMQETIERLKAQRDEQAARYHDHVADMPTIWEDPAGKGYPCFERPMTPKEAKETIERWGAELATASRRVAVLEEAIDAALDAARSFADCDGDVVASEVRSRISKALQVET